MICVGGHLTEMYTCEWKLKTVLLLKRASLQEQGFSVVCMCDVSVFWLSLTSPFEDQFRCFLIKGKTNNVNLQLVVLVIILLLLGTTLLVLIVVHGADNWFHNILKLLFHFLDLISLGGLNLKVSTLLGCYLGNLEQASLSYGLHTWANFISWLLL